VHIPYIIVNCVETSGHVAVTEYFCNPANAPTGRATTLWKRPGRTFVPGPGVTTSG
jgi:hypothetical protein